MVVVVVAALYYLRLVTMAERDEAMHYLLNKLKSEDGWSGSNLAWNEDKLALISGQFSSFDSSAKVKVLLSFLGMTPRTISQVGARTEHRDFKSMLPTTATKIQYYFEKKIPHH